MNRRGAGFGILLLLAGIVWALVNFGVIGWSFFNALYYLWPLVFVVIGVSIIFRKSAIIRAASWIIFPRQ